MNSNNVRMVQLKENTSFLKKARKMYFATLRKSWIEHFNGERMCYQLAALGFSVDGH